MSNHRKKTRKQISLQIKQKTRQEEEYCEGIILIKSIKTSSKNVINKERNLLYFSSSPASLLETLKYLNS
jgi:type IV secretory pathway TraG/TraD family ATPase VirD4